MKRFAVTAALMVSAVLVIAQPASASWQQQNTPTPLGSNPTWSLSAVSCTATTSCVAAGNVDGSLLSETRSGNTWTIVSIPDPGSGQLPGISCTAPTACEAGGQFTSGGTVQTLAEVWNGSNWAIQTTPNVGGTAGSQLNGISCTAATVCEAAGPPEVKATLPRRCLLFRGVTPITISSLSGVIGTAVPCVLIMEPRGGSARLC